MVSLHSAQVTLPAPCTLWHGPTTISKVDYIDFSLPSPNKFSGILGFSLLSVPSTIKGVIIPVTTGTTGTVTRTVKKYLEATLGKKLIDSLEKDRYTWNFTRKVL